MDLKRLAVVVFQRLAPIYIAVALSWVTGYAVFTIGGIGLAIALELAWPLLRPLGEVLYEELLAQHSQAQALRRTALLKTFLPFFQAYKTGWCPCNGGRGIQVLEKLYYRDTTQNGTHDLSTRHAHGVCARSRSADRNVR